MLHSPGRTRSTGGRGLRWRAGARHDATACQNQTPRRSPARRTSPPPRPSTRRPSEPAAAEDVEVEVENALPRIRAPVGDDPIATGAGHGGGRAGDTTHDAANVGRIRRWQLGDVGDVSARNHEDVDGRLGVGVVECDDLLVLVGERRRQLSARDSTEQAVRGRRGSSSALIHPRVPDQLVEERCERHQAKYVRLPDADLVSTGVTFATSNRGRRAIRVTAEGDPRGPDQRAVSRIHRTGNRLTCRRVSGSAISVAVAARGCARSLSRV